MIEALEEIDNRMFGIRKEAQIHREEYTEHAKSVTEQLEKVTMRGGRAGRGKIADKLTKGFGNDGLDKDQKLGKLVGAFGNLAKKDEELDKKPFVKREFVSPTREKRQSMGHAVLKVVGVDPHDDLLLDLEAVQGDDETVDVIVDNFLQLRYETLLQV